MRKYNRRNTSFFGQWWWTIDRYSWVALMVLVGLGMVLVAASSPPVAERIGLSSFHFVQRQYVFLALSLVVMFAISNLPSSMVRRAAVLLFLASLIAMVLLPVIGFENKGAVRWIRFAGMSLQPSEFMKPAFAVVIGWLLAERTRTPGFPGYKISFVLYAIVAGLLITQPDFGMTMTVTAMFVVQLFLAGISMGWVLGLGAAGIALVIIAYNALPHVQSRIDRFLDPSSGDNYQVQKSLDAFSNGGAFGQGLGEGTVKRSIPDAHTDFVFAVAGEEFGMILTLLIIGVFAFVVLRGYLQLITVKDRFIMLAVSGILAQFGIQAIVNMGVAVNLLPAKGMTLPFLSYGGSSLLAIAIGMGMMLALTRKRYGE